MRLGIYCSNLRTDFLQQQATRMSEVFGIPYAFVQAGEGASLITTCDDDQSFAQAFEVISKARSEMQTLIGGRFGLWVKRGHEDDFVALEEAYGELDALYQKAKDAVAEFEQKAREDADVLRGGQ